MAQRVIYLQVQAPVKPAIGAACNGCGVCCAWQPCPLGMLVSRRRHGSCSALHWNAEVQRYRCAVIAAPQTLWPRLPALLHIPLAWLARRWIGAGLGCDSDLDATPARQNSR
jgi:hypothetical protein